MHVIDSKEQQQYLYALVVTPYIDGFTNLSLPVFDCINYAYA